MKIIQCCWFFSLLFTLPVSSSPTSIELFPHGVFKDGCGIREETLPGLIQQFGKFKKSENKKVKNLHEGNLDTVTKYSWPNLEATFLFAKSINKTMLLIIEIHGKHEGVGKIKFGDIKDKILKTFGKYSEKENPLPTKEITYRFVHESDITETLRFSIKDGKVNKIECVTDTD